MSTGSPLPPRSSVEENTDIQKENTPNYTGDGKNEQRKSAPKALWECNICLETAKEPIITQCGHLYCWPCIHKWLIMYPMHRNCPVCNKDIVEELLIPLYGNESDWQPSRKGNGGSVGVGVGVGSVGRSGSGGGNVDDNGSGKEMDARKIPSRPQGVHLPPNPNTTNSLAQASPTDAGDLMRVADAYPQQNNRRFGSSVPGVAFQFGFRLLVTGESPGYAQQQALLSWMLLLLGSFVVFCLLVF